MRARRGTEAGKTWVHLSGDGHRFDRTNGLAVPPDPVPVQDGVSDEQRAAAAAVIGNGFSARM